MGRSSLARQLTAVCAPGLEAGLRFELEALGLRCAGPSSEEDKGQGLQVFNGSLFEGAKVCLYSRIATTVRAHLLVCEASKVRELRQALGKLHLQDYLQSGAAAAKAKVDSGNALPLQVSSKGSKLRHTKQLYELVEQAFPQIAFCQGSGGLQLRLESNRATLSLDLAGERLHKRGWRREGGRAPLRETLACGLLSLAGWRPGEALWDPMAGSGTIPIEATRWALGYAPGAARRFAVEDMPAFAKYAARFEGLRAQALALETKRSGETGLSAPILASDAHRGAVASIRRNAKRAGVEGELGVTLQRLPEVELPPQWPKGGLILCNAPYGRRVGGDREEVLQAHQALGNAMRGPLEGSRLALLTRDARLAEATGLALEPIERLHNGGLPVILYLAGKR